LQSAIGDRVFVLGGNAQIEEIVAGTQALGDLAEEVWD
jgi:hypothetical protein